MEEKGFFTSEKSLILSSVQLEVLLKPSKNGHFEVSQYTKGLYFGWNSRHFGSFVNIKEQLEILKLESAA